MINYDNPTATRTIKINLSKNEILGRLINGDCIISPVSPYNGNKVFFLTKAGNKSSKDYRKKMGEIFDLYRIQSSLCLDIISKFNLYYVKCPNWYYYGTKDVLLNNFRFPIEVIKSTLVEKIRKNR